MRDDIKYTMHKEPEPQSQQSYKEASTFDEHEGTDLSLTDTPQDLSSLLHITEGEQNRKNYTIEDKKPVLVTPTANNPSVAKKPSLKKKDSSVAYRPRRLVAPPEYPYAYFKLKDDERCKHCGEMGKDCHNIRYGLYLSADICRFHRKNKQSYNEHDATSRFIERYHVLAEFDDFLDTSTIPGEEEHYLPECLTMDGLVFALNAVEWTIMWSETKQCLRKV